MFKKFVMPKQLAALVGLDSSPKACQPHRESPLVGLGGLVRMPVKDAHQALIDELNQLNGRWQKGVAMENAGKFQNMPAPRLRRIESEFSRIVNRAAEIWGTLKAEAPVLLENKVFLEP